MKCEKCERDLIGDSVICGDCGHDSSLRRASLTRAQDQNNNAIGVSLGSEANLIPFPKSTGSISANAESDLDVVPVWRNVVKERVRQFREQRPELSAAELELAEMEGVEQNPIVAAALKRLQKSPGQFSEQRGSGFSGAAAASVAQERFEDRIRPSTSSATSVRRDTAGLPRPAYAGIDYKSARVVESQPASGRSPSRTAPENGSEKAESAKAESQSTSSLQPIIPPVPASLWDRTLAGLFDFLLILVACVPLYSIHSITGLRFGQSAAYAVIGIAIWITFLYQMWTMLVAGRTCGMAWRHLRVVDANNRDPLFPQWRLIVRSICGTVSLLLPPLNLAVIWASGNQSGLPDLLSTTMLLQTHATRSDSTQV